MIRIDSSDQDILREINEGYSKAEYWLKKRICSRSAYEDYFRGMYNRALNTRQSVAGEVSEYIDKHGNKWRSFYAMVPRNGDKAITVYVSFVYYETLGSCGAFVPVVANESDKKKSVMIFTAHFFQRMCERLEIPYRSSAMIQKFLNMMTCITVQRNGDSVVVNLPGSQGRGKIRYNGEEGEVFEIRTFLKNTQLSGKQKRETEELRRLGGIEMLFDHEIKKLTSKLGDDKEDQEAVLNELLDQCEVRGMDRDVVVPLQHGLSFIVDRFIQLGYTNDMSDTVKKVYDVAFMLMYDAMAKCNEQECKNKPFPKSLDASWEVVRIASYTAEKMGISQFNMKDFLSYENEMTDAQAEMFDLMLKEYEEAHKEEHKKFGECFGVSMYE